MDDIDWNALGKQFDQDDVLIRVVQKIGRAQGHYFKALTDEGIDPMTALSIVSITVKEVGTFAHETLPIIVQLFLDARKDYE